MQYSCQQLKLAQDLRKLGVPCREFKQGQDRLKSDTLLYKLYNNGDIINIAHAKLRQHVLAAVAKEYPDEKLRIIKPENAEEESSKVDLAVAQSMAAYQAYLKSSGGWALSGD